MKQELESQRNDNVQLKKNLGIATEIQQKDKKELEQIKSALIKKEKELQQYKYTNEVRDPTQQ